jgi:hypothetical protein
MKSMASVMAASIRTITDWLTNLIEYGFIEPHSTHPGTFAPLPGPSFPMPTEVAHVRAALIGHVATFDTAASLDAWIEGKTEENRLLDTPLPLAEAIREAGYILAARAALHVKSQNSMDADLKSDGGPACPLRPQASVFLYAGSEEANNHAGVATRPNADSRAQREVGFG